MTNQPPPFLQNGDAAGSLPMAPPPSAYPTAPGVGAFPGFGYQAPRRGLSLASMIVGLASILFGFTMLAPAVAVVLGILGLRREPAARGMAITGVVLGGILFLGWALLWVFSIVAIVTGAVDAASASSAT